VGEKVWKLAQGKLLPMRIGGNKRKGRGAEEKGGRWLVVKQKTRKRGEENHCTLNWKTGRGSKEQPARGEWKKSTRERTEAEERGQEDGALSAFRQDITSHGSTGKRKKSSATANEGTSQEKRQKSRAGHPSSTRRSRREKF